MPDVTIIKLKIRRGTNLQRQSVVLEQGELGFTTDTKRVFVGDGVLSGGNIVGNIAWSPQTRTTLQKAVIGDTVYDNNKLYQFTGPGPYNLSGSWTYIGTQIDNASLTLSGTNNILALRNQGITGSKFATSAASGGLIATLNNGISANVDNYSISINNTNQLYVSAIDQNAILTSALGNGLRGGSGTTISINANSTTFGYNGSILALTALPANIVTTNSLSTIFVGQGLNINNDRLNTDIQTFDSSLNLLGNQLGLSQLNAGIGPTNWQKHQFDIQGRFVSTSNMVIDTLSAGNSGLLSCFNGHPNQTFSGSKLSAFTNQTLVGCISTNSSGGTAVKTLTSAGFITFTTTTSQNGLSISNFAIPVFSY